MPDQHSVLDPNYKFRYESDWHAYSLLSFAQQTHNALNKNVRSERAIGTLVHHFIKAADWYYRRGLQLLEEPSNECDGEKNTPFHRHQLIERIGDEWAEIMPLASASRLLSEVDEQVLSILSDVIEDALDNLNLEQKEVAIMPHFGRHFELLKFRYAPEVAMLGIPLTSLYCPWEWSIIWHEVAGLYIVSEEAKIPVEALLDEIKALPEEIWADWSDKYYKEMEHLPLADDESHDHDASASYSHEPPEWVLRNWSEEFIEDAVGVLCLGNSMAHGLTQILSQHYNLEEFLAQGIRSIIDSNIEPGEVQEVGSDTRHPPAQLRILVAHSLSHLMGLEEHNVKDKGVRRLAQVIFEHRDKIVNRTFSSQDAASAQNLDPTIGLVIDKQTAPHHWVASAVGAFRGVTEALEEGVEEVLDEVLEQGLDEALDSRVQPIKSLVSTLFASPPPPHKQKGRDHERLVSFHSDLQQIATFHDLLEHLFSERDRGTASAEGSHSHRFGVGWLHIKFSGVVSHGTSHSGHFRFPHGRHSHS
ncbi:MAG: hypothetical protein ACPGWR_08155 [Ardenticatenaceae bacterium]